MCTVTFIARRSGYLLGMNRDEKLSRAKGLPPRTTTVGDREVIYPSEPGGGTWISLNDARTTFALINWYSVKTVVNANPVSRGVVVKTVAAESAAAAVPKILAGLPLKQINPFRLVGIFGVSEEIFEWRWDLKTLAGERRPWISQQWISSGFDEPQAQRIRSKTFETAFLQKSAGNLEWLRRLHRSHSPTRGPFSTCMHRPDAVSVSYTEISVSSHRATLAHGNEPPCHCAR